MRKLKKEILEFLQHDDFDKKLKEIHNYPSEKVINTLFLFLCSTNQLIKERAAKSMGEVVAIIAEHNMDYARVIVRRLMISLTEESGAVGWGAPLAMGEILARNRQLADEYHKILISYAMENDDNYLEFEGLQKDVIKGLKRLNQVYPEMLAEIKELLADH
jgi:hypothetical protein